MAHSMTNSVVFDLVALNSPISRALLLVGQFFELASFNESAV